MTESSEVGHAFWIGFLVSSILHVALSIWSAWLHRAIFGVPERVWHYRHVIRYRAARGESLQSIAKDYGVEVRHVEALTRWGFSSNGDAA